jgi:2-phospho-L-lactate guanylyltransferase
VSGIVAIVPIRSFRDGKTRLASAIEPADRERIVRSMFGAVIAAAEESEAVERIVVVTPDEAIERAALARGVEAVRQPADRPGLNASLDIGREYARSIGAEGMVILFGDLPLLEAEDVRSLVGRDAQVVIATDRHGSGTNALLLRFGGPDFEFQFGLDSRQKHFDEAERLGINAVTFVSVGTAFDLDTIDDLEKLTLDGRELPEWFKLAIGGLEEKSA